MKKLFTFCAIILATLNVAFSQVPVPTGLSAASITSTGATLNWNSTAAGSYAIKYKKTSSSTWTSIFNLTTNSTTVTGLTAGTTYEFQVKAFYHHNPSSFSASKMFTTLAACPTPTSLSATLVTAHTAKLNWHSSIALCMGCYNNIKYKKSTASTWTTGTAAGVNPNSLSITGLTANTTYQFQVQSVCSNNPGSYSSIKTFTTPAHLNIQTPEITENNESSERIESESLQINALTCAIPTAVHTTLVTGNDVILNWTSSASSFNVRYRRVGNSIWHNVNATSTTIAISSLGGTTTYQYQVRAVCGSTPGTYSALKTFTTLDGDGCPPPVFLQASSITNHHATLSWSSSNPTNEIWYKKTTSSNWTSVILSTNSKVVSGLTASTSYTFKVRARCVMGIGAWSATKTFTTASHLNLDASDSENNTSGDRDSEEITTSIEESLAGVTELNVSVYPNPAQGFTNIVFEGDNVNTQIKLYDLMGQVVFSENVNTNNYVLHLENFPTGIYQLAIQRENSSFMKKLIVQKQ
jgi:hypothetical protein